MVGIYGWHESSCIAGADLLRVDRSGSPCSARLRHCQGCRGDLCGFRTVKGRYVVCRAGTADSGWLGGSRPRGSGRWPTAPLLPADFAGCRSAPLRVRWTFRLLRDHHGGIMWFMPRAAREGCGDDSGCAFTDRIRSPMLATCSAEEVVKRVRYELTIPPSALITWPVMYDDASLSRNSTTCAISAGSPKRPSAVAARY
jgi:hypothetical protein